jgi:hypothetical protein
MLIERGVAAIAAGRPNWAGLPICAESRLLVPGSPAAYAVAGAVTLATAAVVGAVWRRRKVMV